MKRDYYYDLHCHTTFSPDAPLTIKRLIKMAKKRGLDGVAITDHNKVYRGPLNIDGVDIIPGSEIDVKGGVHLLAYFIENEVEEGKNFHDAIKEVQRQKAVAIWAHPLRKEGVLEDNKDVFNIIDGLESGNAMDLKSHQKKLEMICENENLLQTAGSDGHVDGQIGTAVIKVSEKLTKENFKRVLMSGKVIVRKEIDDFRSSNQIWKKRSDSFFKKIKIHELGLFKTIFCKIVLRNYLRINNFHLRKINFSYKENGEDI
jgi:predicted metal-dependent phosphoesterase TrpH